MVTHHTTKTQREFGPGSDLPQTLHVWKTAKSGQRHPVGQLCIAGFNPHSTFTSTPALHRQVTDACPRRHPGPQAAVPSSTEPRSRTPYVPFPRVSPKSGGGFSRAPGLAQTGEHKQEEALQEEAVCAHPALAVALMSSHCFVPLPSALRGSRSDCPPAPSSSLQPATALTPPFFILGPNSSGKSCMAHWASRRTGCEIEDTLDKMSPLVHFRVLLVGHTCETSRESILGIYSPPVPSGRSVSKLPSPLLCLRGKEGSLKRRWQREGGDAAPALCTCEAHNSKTHG